MGLLPQEYLQAVMPIGVERPRSSGQYSWIGTGFFVALDFQEKNEKGGKRLRLFYVSCAHVFEQLERLAERAVVRGNPAQGTQALILDIELKDAQGRRTWLRHPDPLVDAGMLAVNVPRVLELGGSLAHFEAIATGEEMLKFGISVGDEVFVLGFPMGEAGIERNYVTVRGGTIARFDEEILRQQNAFLVDATVFPGNSGGPVVYKPQVAAVGKLQPIKIAYLIGIVSAYKTYSQPLTDPSSSLQFALRVNTGLAVVVPLDWVYEVGRKWLDHISSSGQIRPEQARK